MKPYSKTEIVEMFGDFLKKNGFSEDLIIRASQLNGIWVQNILRSQTDYFHCCDVVKNSIVNSVLLSQSNLDKVIFESMRVARLEILKVIRTEKRLLKKK